MKNIFQIVCVSVLTVLAVSAFSSVVSAQEVKGQETSVKGQEIVKGQRGKQKVQDDGLVTTENGLPVKLVVTKNTAVYRPKLEEKVENPIEPFNFYWKLKTVEPKDYEDKKWLYFGTPDGKPVGWIKEDDCKEWKTLFCFDPVKPTDKVYFSVYEPKDTKCEGKPIAEFAKSDAENQQRLALMLDSIDGKPVAITKSDPVYVAVMLGNVKKAGKPDGTSPNAPPTARDLTLDFVFVVDTTGSMMPAIEACRSIMKDTVTELSGKEILKGKVRFGLVEYRDEDSYVSKTTQTLTNDYVKFQSILDNLDVGGGGDEEEEGLAGLKEAIDNAGWDKNSAKYLFLIGDAPLKGKGEKKQAKADCRLTILKNLLPLLLPRQRETPMAGR
jgi:hypothetical protein